MAQEERDRVKNDLEAKEKELKKAQDEQAQLSTKLQSMKDEQNQLNNELNLLQAEGQKIRSQLDAAIATLDTSLQSTPFQHRESLEAALLSYEAEQQARALIREMEREETELQTRQQQWTIKSEQLADSKNFEITHEEATAQKTSLNQQKDDINRALGSIKQKLLLDDKIRKRNQEIFVAIDAQDRKSTRLNSSHQIISYAVFCLKKKTKKKKEKNKTKKKIPITLHCMVYTRR